MVTLNGARYYEVYWQKEASDITEDWRELEHIKKKFYQQLTKNIMALDHINKEWMEFFNKNRDLWSPIASEWKRLSQEYLETKQTI